MSDRLNALMDDAFRDIVEAEELIYAAGMSREIKDAIVEAHSALLKARGIYAASERRRIAMSRVQS